MILVSSMVEPFIYGSKSYNSYLFFLSSLYIFILLIKSPKNGFLLGLDYVKPLFYLINFYKSTPTNGSYQRLHALLLSGMFYSFFTLSISHSAVFYKSLEPFKTLALQDLIILFQALNPCKRLG